VVSTAFIRDFLIGEADIVSFSCYSKPPASAGGAFATSSIKERAMKVSPNRALWKKHGKHAGRNYFCLLINVRIMASKFCRQRHTAQG
jgi:hypothetical protein